MTENLPFRRILLVCPESLSPREAALAHELAVVADLRIVVSTWEHSDAAPKNVRVVGLRSLGSVSRDWQPEIVLYASAPAAGLHWRVWWWQRRRAREALLGGFWRLPTTAEKTGRLRRSLDAVAAASLDFRLVEHGEDVERLVEAGVGRGRVWAAGSPGAATESLPAFLERRLRAEARSILWVDDEISLNSPSTKHLVYSLPHLRAEGWEVRGWCLTADATTRDGVEIRQFSPAPRWLGAFAPYWFCAGVNLYGVGRTILKGRPPARVVHTVGGAFFGADAVSIQFVGHVYLPMLIRFGVRNIREAAMLVLIVLIVCRDQIQFANPRCKVFLPASDSIGDEVRRRCLPQTEVRTLANSYDETRFNPGVRQREREPMRRELGFGDGDTVFSFASQGHYKRKGFWLAVAALDRVRRRADLPQASGVKFLVIGGQSSTLAKLQAELVAAYPDWKAWITFVGTQPALEKYLVAADAFLFPSYFEAFCLAEIEAGALGLPLLLTPHHGTEMILRDGVNGLRLEFDPARMEESLAGFLRNGLPPFQPGAGRALNRGEYAQALAEQYERLAVV